MKKILLPNPLPLEWLLPYANEYEFTNNNHHLNKAEIIEQIPEHDVFFTIYCPVDEEILLAGNKLKIINTFGVGYNHINIAAAKQLGVKVCNCPTAVTLSTAELGMGMIFNLLRRMTEADRRMRAGDQTIWGALGLTGTNLQGKKLGIIGFGRIGQKMPLMQVSSVWKSSITIEAIKPSKQKKQQQPIYHLTSYLRVVTAFCFRYPYPRLLLG